MDAVFVDSNVFLRYLTADDEEQSAQAKNLFQKAIEGKVNLITGPPVLFEISWTLKVRYKRNAAEILDILEALVSASWLSMADKNIAERAVMIARQSGQDFADAYIHESALKMSAQSIATFNRKHFARMDTHLMDL
jgi:predicted nucleic-acid-binding protein